LSRVLPSVLQGSLGLVSNPVSGNLDHISGLDTVKMDLIKTIVWPLTVPEAFRRMGIEPSRGTIFLTTSKFSIFIKQLSRLLNCGLLYSIFESEYF